MKRVLISGLVASTAAATALLATSVSSAQAFSVTPMSQSEALAPELWSEFNAKVNGESTYLYDQDLTQLDASQLFWDGGVDGIEIYFINEGAGYRNQLFVSANDTSTDTYSSSLLGSMVQDGTAAKVFDDITLTGGSDSPIYEGQGVRLSGFEGPTQLDFLLKANGFNGGTTVYGTVDERNPDNIMTHVTAFEYNGYVMLGFEDLWNGGDRDYNDAVFVVKGIQQGAPTPAEDVPEPTTILGLLLLGAGGLTTLRRQALS
jgi:hypothetical protein